MLLPIRHIRPHIGFTWLLDDPQVGDSKLVHLIMEPVEESVVGQIFTYGKLCDTVHMRYYLFPPDLLSRPPVLYHESKQLATILGVQSFEGVQFGTDCKFTAPLQNTTRGKLITWNRSLSSNYEIKIIRAYQRFSLVPRGSSSGFCFVMLNSMEGHIEENGQEEDIIPDGHLESIYYTLYLAMLDRKV